MPLTDSVLESPPTIKDFPSQNVSSTKLEKPWCVDKNSNLLIFQVVAARAVFENLGIQKIPE